MRKWCAEAGDEARAVLNLGRSSEALPDLKRATNQPSRLLRITGQLSHSRKVRIRHLSRWQSILLLSQAMHTRWQLGRVRYSSVVRGVRPLACCLYLSRPSHSRYYLGCCCDPNIPCTEAKKERRATTLGPKHLIRSPTHSSISNIVPLADHWLRTPHNPTITAYTRTNIELVGAGQWALCCSTTALR